jgi:hypothetical protein
VGVGHAVTGSFCRSIGWSGRAHLTLCRPHGV